MGSFLAPSRSKILGALLGFLVLPACLVLRAVPAPLDLLDLNELGGRVLGLLLGLPMRLFDLATGSAFAPRSEGFLGFPGLPQLAFALAADLVVFYLIACSVFAWRQRRNAAGRGGSSPRTSTG